MRAISSLPRSVLTPRAATPCRRTVRLRNQGMCSITSSEPGTPVPMASELLVTHRPDRNDWEGAAHETAGGVRPKRHKRRKRVGSVVNVVIVVQARKEA